MNAKLKRFGLQLSKFVVGTVTVVIATVTILIGAVAGVAYFGVRAGFELSVDTLTSRVKQAPSVEPSNPSGDHESQSNG